MLGVLHGHGDDIAVAVYVEQRVFIQVACLGDSRLVELDVKRIGILEIFDVQGA